MNQKINFVIKKSTRLSKIIFKMNKKNVEILQVLTDEKTKDRKCLRIISLTE